MNMITTLLLPGTLIVSWVAIVVGILFLVSAKKQIAKSQNTCEKLARDLQVASNGAAGMGQRIISLEKKLATMNHVGVNCLNTSQSMENIQFNDANINVSQQKAISNKNQSSKKTPSVFDQAKQLLRNGISERQVVKTCGLSPDEVALMNVLIKNNMDKEREQATVENGFQHQMRKVFS